MAKITEAATTESTPRKPLLFADNPFGDDRQDDVEFVEAMFDSSYVPGYSDRRRENELRVRAGKAPLKMPRLQWVRVVAGDGTTVRTSDEGMMDWMRQGYRALGLDELKGIGCELPPTAHVGPDGLIRRGDLALFIVGESRAERNRVRQDALNRDQIRQPPKNGATGAIYEVEEERESLRPITSDDLPNL
jgi:hypothetical protein